MASLKIRDLRRCFCCYLFRFSPGSQKRSLKSHDPTSNNHPASRDSVANKQNDLELEQRCKDHIVSLRLSAEEDLSDDESFNGVDWLKEVEAAISL
jgi:hypothetical protein